MHQRVKFITTTGLLLALTILFQLLGKTVPLGPAGNFLTGSFVNACLLIGTSIAGPGAATIICFAAPIGAALSNSAIPWIFIPFIAIGNFSLIYSFHLLRKQHVAIQIVVPAIVKTIILYSSVYLTLSLLNFPMQQSKIILYMFSWPQLITACIGGILTVAIVDRLKKISDSEKKEPPRKRSDSIKQN